MPTDPHTAKMTHPDHPGEIKEVPEAELVPYMVAGWQQVKPTSEPEKPE